MTTIMGKELPLPDQRASLLEQFPQDCPMATLFICAITADGKIRMVRKRSKQIEVSAGGGLLHFCQKPAFELFPAGLIFKQCRFLQERFAWCQIRKPDVVEVLCRKVILAHASRRTTDRADAEPFIS